MADQSTSAEIVVADPTKLEALARLNAKQRVEARRLAAGLDHDDTMAVTTFASQPQQQMSASTDPILAMVRAKDAGQAGVLLSGLLAETKSIDPKTLLNAGTSGVRAALSKIPGLGAKLDQATAFIASFEKVGEKIERIAHQLEAELRTLGRDVQTLDKLYRDNETYFHQLMVYIAAGEIKLAQLKTEHSRLQAESAGDPFKAQEVADMAGLITRLERRVYDLKLTAVLALQTGPQIRLVQASNQALAEKIQQSILTTIPLWKQQAIIAISLFNQRKAIELQNAVTDTTNDLLTANAQLLRQGVTDVARATERGVVEVETLVATHEQLVATIEETLAIQADGRQKRQAGEAQIAQLTQAMNKQLSG